MNSRRDFIKQSLILAGGGLLSGGMGLMANASQAASTAWRMPDEGESHAATWMAFGPDEEIWGSRLQTGAREALAEIARAIAQFEPVNMLVRPEEYDVAARMCGDKVKLIEAAMDDLWLRDTGPVFVKKANGERAAVSFNFNGWGNKQPHADDARLAGLIADKTSVSLLHSKLVLEGGGIEVDGEGTAIITESCVLNPNRNPGVSKAACEAQLKALLGLDKIIWLPGIAGKDITDGHTDFYARFASPGVVVAGLDNDPSSYDYAVTRRHLGILRNASDARGRKLKIVEMPGPSSIRKKYENDEFAAGYINFYVCNKAVIAPQFGDTKSDSNSRAILRELFPGREVIQLNIDAIAAGGGGIHCTTQQQPG
ncbi:agmatine deiminase [Aquitalea sp. FJL05]|uniref:agmatine deiminase family protein n=1 Tax=Aquitalea TaxID=407217 RepID=UPI000F59DD91|nr:MULTISPECIES: agmatine deiminase family protein [Aquitalea]RQO69216.1 agmatine deiminase [Aquitalea sp. FJL05]